jgi:hypothetical protein
VTSDQWKERDRERRETVERYHRKDFEDDFVVAKHAAKTCEERQRLMNEMGAYRQKHRHEDVARGKRVPGGRIQMVHRRDRRLTGPHRRSRHHS